MGILDFIRPQNGGGDPNAAQADAGQWSDVPFGYRIALLGSVLSAASRGESAPMGGFAAMAKMTQDAVEQRKKAKMLGLAAKYLDKRPDLKALVESGAIDISDIIKWDREDQHLKDTSAAELSTYTAKKEYDASHDPDALKWDTLLGKNNGASTPVPPSVSPTSTFSPTGEPTPASMPGASPELASMRSIFKIPDLREDEAARLKMATTRTGLATALDGIQKARQEAAKPGLETNKFILEHNFTGRQEAEAAKLKRQQDIDDANLKRRQELADKEAERIQKDAEETAKREEARRTANLNAGNDLYRDLSKDQRQMARDAAKAASDPDTLFYQSLHPNAAVPVAPAHLPDPRVEAGLPSQNSLSSMFPPTGVAGPAGVVAGPTAGPASVAPQVPQADQSTLDLIKQQAGPEVNLTNKEAGIVFATGSRTRAGFEDAIKNVLKLRVDQEANDINQKAVEATQEKADAQKSNSLITTVTSLDEAYKLLDSEGGDTGAGWRGKWFNWMPETNAYNVGTPLQTAKDALAIGKLGDLREASKSGASGLGQASTYEERMMANAYGTLDQGQDAPTLRRHIKETRARVVAFTSLAKEDPTKSQLQYDIEQVRKSPTPQNIAVFDEKYGAGASSVATGDTEPSSESNKSDPQAQDPAPRNVSQELWDTMTATEKAAWPKSSPPNKSKP